MKRRMIPAIPSLTLAVLVLLVAGATALGALVRAIDVRERTTVGRDTIVMPASLHMHGGMSGTRYSPLADDPFFPDRTPPTTRYRLAGVESPVPGPVPGPEPIMPQILGTVVVADGSSFAIGRVGDEPPKPVRVGGSIGGYRVEKIERTRVAFVSPTGQRITVANTRPASGADPVAGMARRRQEANNAVPLEPPADNTAGDESLFDSAED